MMFSKAYRQAPITAALREFGTQILGYRLLGMTQGGISQAQEKQPEEERFWFPEVVESWKESKSVSTSLSQLTLTTGQAR